MKFLVDAQLPRRLAHWLACQGHDALHTLDLPHANATPDDVICSTADQQNRVVVTKDDDFVYSHLVRESPQRLLLVSTGNISNNSLLSIFDAQLTPLLDCLADTAFVELTRDSILLHE